MYLQEKYMTLRPPAVVVFALLLALFALLAPFAGLPQQKLESTDADRVKAMLDTAYQEAKKHYYDANFHGLDWDARYTSYKEKMKHINSLANGFSLVADFLDGLNDSHTFFIPPARPARVECGFQMIMIGDKPFILRARPDTDAESKVHPGDEILTYNKFAVTRATAWKMDYYYKVLSPQVATALLLSDPGGQQREAKVSSKIIELKRRLDFTGADAGNDFYDMIRQRENADHQSRQRYVEAGDVMIWKMPSFLLDETAVDNLFETARKHKALILDLRENPGGAVTALDRMLGNVFEQDVKIGDRTGRKELKPELAKGRGKNAFSGQLIVLVDSKSASAAEIFARVIQLEHRGTVIGDRSSGMVMESQVYGEKLGFDVVVFYGFNITMADFIMKDGKSLEHVGVTPDEIVLPTASDLANSRDPAMVRAAALAGLNLEPAQAGKLFPYEWPPL